MSLHTVVGRTRVGIVLSWSEFLKLCPCLDCSDVSPVRATFAFASVGAHVKDFVKVSRSLQTNHMWSCHVYTWLAEVRASSLGSLLLSFPSYIFMNSCLFFILPLMFYFVCICKTQFLYCLQPINSCGFLFEIRKLASTWLSYFSVPLWTSPHLIWHLFRNEGWTL